MKKSLFAFVFMCLALCASVSQSVSDSSILSPFGSPWQASGTVSEITVLHDLDGGCYALYVEDGSLKVVRAKKDGSTAPYDLIPAGRTITGVRSLRTPTSGLWRYVSFIGTENGKERIYLARLGFLGDLSLFESTLESEVAGVIGEVTLIQKAVGSVEVYYLSGGMLFHSRCEPDKTTVVTKERISESMDRVSSYSVYQPFNNDMLSYCSYVVVNTDGELSLRFIKSQGSLISYMGAILPVSVSARYGIYEKPDGLIFCQVIDGKNTSEYLFTETGIKNGFAINAPLTIEECNVVYLNNESLWFLVCVDDELRTVYCTESTGRSNVKLSKLADTVQCGNSSQISIQADSILFLTKTSNGWVSVPISNSTSVGAESVLTGLSETAQLLWIIQGETIRALFLSNEETLLTLSTFENSGTGWKIVDKKPIVITGNQDELSEKISKNTLSKLRTRTLGAISGYDLNSYWSVDIVTNECMYSACSVSGMSQNVNAEVFICVQKKSEMQVNKAGN